MPPKFKKYLRQSLFFLAIVLPVVLTVFFSYARLSRYLDDALLARRKFIARLAGAVLKERLEELVNLGVSFSTRRGFIEFLGKKEWSPAIDRLSNVRNNFPFIEQIFIADIEGNVRAGLPEQPDLINKNFSFRDWYKGVSRDWKPYISEVYKTRYKPYFNAVAVAIPVRDEDSKVLGILAFLVKTDTFLEWTKSFEAEKPGFVYIVNHKGQLVAHPRFQPQDDIIDFSAVPTVNKILKGQSGLEMTYNPIEKEDRLSAYEPIEGYGWGVVFTEPKSQFMDARSRVLKLILLIFALIFLMSVFIALFILFYLQMRQRTEDRILQLNKELEERNVDLLSLNKELEFFSYSVSHDLRAPLRSMEGFSKILLEEEKNVLTPECKDCLSRIRLATQHMSELIDDLLDLSRVSRGALHYETVDLSVLAEQIAEEIKNGTPGRQARFIIAPGLEARGDKRLLQIVLQNLLSNSWKFTGKNPDATIEVGRKQIEGKQAYFVRDDGVGFDMAYADKLFGAFQRLHSQSEFPGTGIGLATVQRIIHRHGGRVWAEGSVGKGATFYFTL